MIRNVYKAVIKKDCGGEVRDFLSTNCISLSRLVEEGILMTISVYIWKYSLFTYYECMDKDMTPSEILKGLDKYLDIWPDEVIKYWAPMVDIFHMNEPQSVEHWARKEPVEKRVGYIARLKPGMVSSYVYYHYQLQEEQAWNNNKYCYIGLLENMIFLYEEIPNLTEKPLHKGKLTTSYTPSPEEWPYLMDPHFETWEDASEEERQIRTLEMLYCR